ncbi:MAG: SEC-C domain-containing protein [Parvularculaceae bacterium]|nr:SEC-C domain-containing protein [Parvularculaceae bacterium]
MSTLSLAFERTSKRRKGFPSETNVKSGHRFIRGGEVELVEKLGRNDPCPCGSGRSFQEVLPQGRQISMGATAMIIGGRQLFQSNFRT